MTYAVVYSYNVTPPASLPQPPNNTGVWVIGQDTVQNPALVADSYGATAKGSEIWMRSARGSGASPDFSQAGDVLASVQGRGWNGSGFGARATVDVIANETHSASAGGSQVEIKACREGALALGTTVTHAVDTNGLTRLLFHNLPVSDPHEAERVWNNSGVLTISAG